MAVKARKNIPAYALPHLDFAAIRAADRAQQAVTDIGAGADVNKILSILHQLNADRDNIVEFKDVPGLREYAQAQRNDGVYEIVTEYQALLALIDDAITFIRSAIPVDGAGYLLAYKLVDDKLAPRTFGAGAVSGLVTKLQAISDHVE